MSHRSTRPARNTRPVRSARPARLVRLIRRAVIATAAAAVLAGTTGAAFPARTPGHHRPPATVLQNAPSPHAPEGNTHKLIRDQIDIDLNEDDRHPNPHHHPR
ncbi:hypothetical protein [Streptomyces venezuelae]|uniref:hypothetical protein n=1 Tax=Streptomyces venezuelae TaxID=54571 RepID=UPI003655A999